MTTCYDLPDKDHEATLTTLADLYRAIESYRESLAALRIKTPSSNLDYYMNAAKCELRRYGR